MYFHHVLPTELFFFRPRNIGVRSWCRPIFEGRRCLTVVQTRMPLVTCIVDVISCREGSSVARSEMGEQHVQNTRDFRRVDIEHFWTIVQIGNDVFVMFHPPNQYFDSRSQEFDISACYDSIIEERCCLELFQTRASVMMCKCCVQKVRVKGNATTRIRIIVCCIFTETQPTRECCQL